MKNISDFLSSASMSLNLCRIRHIKNKIGGTSLVVQWLRLHAPTAGGLCEWDGVESIPAPSFE